MAHFDDFLKPESMVTPGVAGGITMMISNTLWVHFGLEQRWTALLISFAFGLLVFVAKHLPIWQRVIYYTINSLIVFSVAAGSNYVGHKSIQGSGSGKEGSALNESLASLNQLLLPNTAYAQQTAPSISNEDYQPRHEEPLEEIEAVRVELAQEQLARQQIEQELVQCRTELEYAKTSLAALRRPELDPMIQELEQRLRQRGAELSVERQELEALEQRLKERQQQLEQSAGKSSTRRFFDSW